MFKKSRVAIFSDIHIGVHQNSKFWHDVSLEWAKWFVADIKKQGIEDVIFWGLLPHKR